MDKAWPKSLIPLPRDHPLAFEVFFSGKAYFDSVKICLEKARRTISVESYIFNFDRIGQEVLLLLQAAQLRGVRVRILVDGVGSMDSIPQLAEFCELCKLEFEVYHPLPFQSRISHSLVLQTFAAWRKRIALIARINKRNHRKIVMIDGNIAFLGSMNIADCHIGSKETLGWRDTGIKIQGPEVKWLAQEMHSTWRRTVNFLERTKRPRALPLWLMLNSKSRWRRHMKRELFARIRMAQVRIHITTPYFVPRPVLLQRLIQAAKRGVDVQLILPENNDVRIVRYASQAFYSELLHWGIKIWEYHPTNLHAKTIVIDQSAFVGSQNLNHRSFLHDLEVEVVTNHPAVVEALQQQWQRDLEQAISTQKLPQKRDLLQILLSWFILRFKYWL